MFLKENRIEIWKILWIEWIYAMFLRTFDLKTSLKFWDFALIKDEVFILKLSFVVFKLISENLNKINKGKFFEEIRLLVLRN